MYEEHPCGLFDAHCNFKKLNYLEIVGATEALGFCPNAGRSVAMLDTLISTCASVIELILLPIAVCDRY